MCIAMAIFIVYRKPKKLYNYASITLDWDSQWKVTIKPDYVPIYNNNTNFLDWMSYGTQWGPADGPGGHPALHVSGAAQPETIQSQG